MTKAKEEYEESLRSNICHNYQTYIFKDTADKYISELLSNEAEIIDFIDDLYQCTTGLVQRKIDNFLIDYNLKRGLQK